jgi:hypothetical protein
MDVHIAANFFVGTILTCGGIVVIGLTAVLLNNIINKYWKPIKWRVYEEYRYDYNDPPMGPLPELEPVSNSNNKITVV